MMFTKSTIVAAASVMMANAANIAVSVGQGGLMYSPSTVTAAKGDVIVFTWASGPHTVTQSTFAAPCTPASGGFDSGMMTTGTYSVTVNDTNPIWVHCGVASHCSTGMVFAANAPTSGNTFTQFQAIAEGKATASAAASSSAAASTGAAAASSTPSKSSSGYGTSSATSVNAFMAAVVGVVGLAAGALFV